MKVRSTSDDLRRIAFVENLYKELRQQTKSAIKEHDTMVAKASNYLCDGVTESECTELLVIDGLSRESAESYMLAARDKSSELISHEYSFQFEDIYGKVWSSYDIGNDVIFASSEQEAWLKAEDAIFSDQSIESERVVSVDRVS